MKTRRSEGYSTVVVEENAERFVSEIFGGV